MHRQLKSFLHFSRYKEQLHTCILLLMLQEEHNMIFLRKDAEITNVILGWPQYLTAAPTFINCLASVTADFFELSHNLHICPNGFCLWFSNSHAERGMCVAFQVRTPVPPATRQLSPQPGPTPGGWKLSPHWWCALRKFCLLRNQNSYVAGNKHTATSFVSFLFITVSFLHR